MFDRQCLQAVSQFRLGQQTVKYKLTAHCDGQDGGSCIGRDRQKLRGCRFIAEGSNYGGEEEREGVERDVTCV